jgi:hypothetical protein
MAVVYNPNQKKDPKNQQQAGFGQTSSGQAAGPIMGGGQAAAGGQTQTPGQQKAGSSGRFQNVQSFIKANQPQQFAQQVSGKVGEVKQGAEQALGKAQSQVQSQAQQIGQQIAQNRQGQQGFAQSFRQGLQQDQAAGDFDQGYEALKSGIGMQYGGVDELQNQAMLRAKAQDLSAVGQAAQSQGGRSALLQRFYGQPGYSAGQRSLDTALLGSQTKDLKRLVGQGGQFKARLGEAVGQAQRDIDTQKAGVAALREESKGLAGALKGEGEADIREQFTKFAEREEAAKQAALAQDRKVAQAMGLDIGAGAKMDLDSKTLQDLGILGFKSDIANINKEDLNQIGRVNVGQAGQVSKLRGLLGESELNLGEQFKQGTEDFNQQELERVMKNLGQDYQGFGRDQYLGHQARVLSGDAAYNRDITDEQVNQRAFQLMREQPGLYGSSTSSATMRKGSANDDFAKAKAAASQQLNAARATEVAKLDALRNRYMTEGTEEHKQARQNVYKQLLQSMAQRAKG